MYATTANGNIHGMNNDHSQYDDDDDYGYALQCNVISTTTSTTTKATTITAKVHYGAIGQLKGIICNCLSFISYLFPYQPGDILDILMASNQCIIPNGIACNTFVSIFYTYFE